MPSSSRTARVTASERTPGSVRNGYPDMNHSSEYVTPWRRRISSTVACDRLHGLLRRETHVEARLQFPGNHVRRAGSRREVRHLKCRRLEMRVALVPGPRHQFRQRRRKRMHGVVGGLRVGHVALDPAYGQAAAQASAPADLDHVAQLAVAGGLADEAPIDPLAARLQHLDDAAGTVDGGPLLVARDQKGDRAAVVRDARATNSSTAVTIAARPLFMSAAPRP